MPSTLARSHEEARDLPFRVGHQAFDARQAQIPAQLAARIGNLRRVAGLVNGVECLEIVAGREAERNGRGFDRTRHGGYTSRMTGRMSGRFEVCLFR